jgi:hypothetical protein
MASPPNSPPHNLQGTSRMTGGIIRGHAQGNILNHANMLEFGYETQPPLLKHGRVLVYTSSNQVEPTMVFKHEVTPSLAPVLRTLKRRYSKFSSKSH